MKACRWLVFISIIAGLSFLSIYGMDDYSPGPALREAKAVEPEIHYVGRTVDRVAIVTEYIEKEVPVYINISKTVKVPQPISQTENASVEVQVPYIPKPFDSTQALKKWLDEYKPYAISFDKVTFNSSCENYAFAMTTAMINDGYLASAQIDPERNHMFVAVPIYSENRFVFVEADTKALSMVFCGKTWRID